MIFPDDFVNKIIRGDCLEIMKQIPDKSIDLILCDPPYGIDFCSSRTNRKERLQNDKLCDWTEMLPKMLSEFKRILTDTGCCCCCCCGGGKTPVTAIYYRGDKTLLFNTNTCLEKVYWSGMALSPKLRKYNYIE
jgi:23S rRNA G2445 N2-methylase RlmL